MYAKNLWIVVVEGGPGEAEITSRSARGLFEKYANDFRSETKLVVWKNISEGGEVSEVKRWEKGGQALSAQQVAPSGTLVDVGLYIVAHGQEGSGQVAGGGPYSLITRLTKANIPRANKVSFVACYSGQQDEGAINDSRMRDFDPTEHGLDVEELSFVSMFSVGYQDAYDSKSPLHVAGWESFVSAYHPSKTQDVPNGATGTDTGRKYVSAAGSNPYTFMKPNSTSRKNKKRMFKWSFVDGSAKVEKIGLADWKHSR